MIEALCAQEVLFSRKIATDFHYIRINGNLIISYEGLGGIQQALSRHADGVYAGFDEQERERVGHVLVRMVRPDEGTEDTRQVATRDQVRPENWPLVTRLANNRLVVTGHDEATDQDTAEIIHEALIHHWRPLREWLREDRAFRVWQNGLRQALGEWERTEKDTGALLAGTRLAEAEERLAAHRERMSSGEVGYIQASVERREAEVVAEKRRNRRFIFGLTGFLIIALALASIAGWQWREAEKRGTELERSVTREKTARAFAEEQKKIAEHQKTVAESRQLATQAELLRKQHAYLLPQSVLLATEAMERFHTLAADQAMYRGLALPGPKPVAERSYKGLMDLVLSPQGRYLVQLPYKGPAEVQETVSGKTIARLINLWGHNNRPVHAIGQVSTRDVRVWSFARIRENLRLSHKHVVRGLRYSPDGRYLATVDGQDPTPIVDSFLRKDDRHPIPE